MSTTTPQNCPQCGAPLPASAKAGLCPRCVMAMNLASQTEFTGEEGPYGTKVLKQAPTPEELAGKFPQLEVLELLGQGGMGAVYKARQKELDRIVALKILPPGIGEDPGFAERFTREAKALAKLHHPNIVTLFEFGRADGLFFFLMELVDGVNLRQLLDTGRVSSREALAIVPQICDALQFAHDQGIVHRDIKPENILMDRRGRVKVADFGLAKIVGTERCSVSRSALEGETDQETSGGVSKGEAAADHGPAPHELTEAGKVMGTPQYMAPEQKHRPFEVDHRADIYALGVVFYQMLTGELPGKPIEPPSSHTRGAQIDVRLDEIVLRALENKPEFRYQQASVLKTQVETVAATSAGAGGKPVLALSQPHGQMPSFDDPVSRVLVIAVSILIAAVWGYFSDLPGEVVWFLGRLITVPAIALSLHWLIVRYVWRAPTLPDADPKWSGSPRERSSGLVSSPLARENRGGGKWALLAGVLIVGTVVVAFLFLEKTFSGVSPKTVIRVEEKLRKEIEKHLNKAGWTVQGLVVNVSPNLARAQCEFEFASLDPATPHPGRIRVADVFGTRIKPAGKNRLSELARKKFPASIQIHRQDQERWTVEGSGEFAFLRFSVDTSTDRSASGFSGTSHAQEHPPFLANYRGGTVGLLALAPHPSTNGLSWLPNGTPASEPFPFRNGKSSAEGKVVKEIAFRIHSENGTASYPVTKYDPKPIGGMGGSFFPAEPKMKGRLFVQTIACPPNAKEVNVQLGVADGDWELVRTLKVTSQLSGSSQMSREDGEWVVQYQAALGGSDDVALAFSYSKRDEWETRMVALKRGGRVMPLIGHRTDDGLTHGVVSLPADEFPEITMFQLQRRKYQWAEFRNVALEPGRRTVVQVTDAAEATVDNSDEKVLREVFGHLMGEKPAWKERVGAMNTMTWRQAYEAAKPIAALPPAEGLAVVREHWTTLTNAQSRQQLQKAFWIAEHPHLVPVLELSYLDTALSVQEGAFVLLRDVSLQDFSEDYSAGKSWLAEHREMLLTDVLAKSARHAAERLSSGDTATVHRQLEWMQFGNVFRNKPEAVAGSGLDEALKKIINGRDQQLAETALRVTVDFEFSPEWYQEVVLPKIQVGNPRGARESALTMLGRRGGDWAVDPLLQMLTNAVSSSSGDERQILANVAGALGSLKATRAIPTMVAVIEAENTYDTAYGVGYFGLGKLTGIKYDESHDGAWWRKWWEKNKQRYPAEIQALEIPRLTAAKHPSNPRSSAVEVASLELLAGGDTNKLFYLIGQSNLTSAHPLGFRLLLVLPGGDGGRNFHPFVKRISQNALPDGYLVAQLVAPRWDEKQFEQLVWPTEQNRYSGMKFSTEQFVDSVIEEVSRMHKIDSRHIYTLSWSSGGPAAYAVSLAPKTPVKGSFVAMSVFKPNQLPHPEAAKGHRYYILHSPEDFIPLSMAETARDLLKRNGAATRLVTYEGGHGWHGDVFGYIRRGLDWLEEQMSVAEILSAIEADVVRLEEAIEAGLLVDMDNTFDRINEYCDQLQGKNKNTAPSAKDWNVDENTHREILKLLAGMEDNVEGMRSVARSNTGTHAERNKVLEHVSEQFLQRYDKFKRMLKAARETDEAALEIVAPRDYKLALTNGTTFEVVAICRNPRETSLWWKPDGAVSKAAL